MAGNGGRFYPLGSNHAPSSNESSQLSSASDTYAQASSFSNQQKYLLEDPNSLAEEDDYLHDSKDDKMPSTGSSFFNTRGVLNILTLALIAMALLMLFLGYPVIIEIRRRLSDYELGVSSGTRMTNIAQRGLIDPDTPKTAMSRTSDEDGSKWHLVFSDEFNTEGRTFFPGDDPYWEAVDIWYWGTGDYEWYTPEAVNTTDGALTITIEAVETNNKNFRSGMVQSWNKVCFQGAYYEFSAILPGSRSAPGFWPGLWTQGNLGRPGYGATNEGLWPYSYNECDTGILPNQTYLDKSGPEKALDAHGLFSQQSNYELSWLPGMRFPSCTCSGEEHPGPSNNVGRSAPELDILEAKIDGNHGQTSQSLQMAPFDIDYYYGNGTGQVKIYDDLTELNDYKGGSIQEAISALSQVPDDSYELSPQPRYTTFGVEYEPDWEGDGKDAYVTWYMDGKPTWTLYGAAIGPVPDLDIGQRLVPREPMVSTCLPTPQGSNIFTDPILLQAMVMNLAISQSFQVPQWDLLEFPAQFKIDYVRVYQKDDRPDRVSCDPSDYPTYNYIEKYVPPLLLPRHLQSFLTLSHLFLFQQQQGHLLQCKQDRVPQEQDP